MKVGMLGTGVVGRTLAGALAVAGDEVVIGTRDPETLNANDDFAGWHADHPAVSVGPFADAAAHGEVVFNVTPGTVSLDVLRSAGRANLDGKILVDVSNPLDFSAGFPPTLSVANTDSLGEMIQRALPESRVVKTLNTVNAALMVEPAGLADADHHLFVSGDDAEAKRVVTNLLEDRFGWRHIIDLGDISTARGTEMLMPMWLRLVGALGTVEFNWRIVA